MARRLLIVGFVLVLATAGYFWWRSGFSLDFNRFFAATPCEDIGLFNNQAECRSVCSSSADSCEYRSGSGCWRVPNGVFCQAACDPYGPPNCTKMPDETNPQTGGCANARVGWSGTFNIPPGATTYQTATFHSPTAGCTKTTEEAGAGGSVQWNPGAGTYTATWNPAALSHNCGRFQFDVALFGPGGRLDGQGVGKVFNTGVNCGVTTPPPTTPPPTTPPSTTPPPTTPPPTTPPPTTPPPTTPPPTTPPPTTPPPTTPPPTTPPPTTPPPTPRPLVCAPANQTVFVGQPANVQAAGGTTPYYWFAQYGSPTTGQGTAFTVRHATAGTFSVQLTDSQGRTAVCQVTSVGTPTPLPIITPPPLPSTPPPPPVVVVPTGPGESAVLALIVSTITVLLYVGYASTEAFRRHEAQTTARRAREDMPNFRR